MVAIKGTASFENLDQDRPSPGSVAGQMQAEVSLKTYILTKKLYK